MVRHALALLFISASYSLLGNLIKFYHEMTSSIVVESILNTNRNRSYLPFVSRMDIVGQCFALHYEIYTYTNPARPPEPTKNKKKKINPSRICIALIISPLLFLLLLCSIILLFLLLSSSSSSTTTKKTNEPKVILINWTTVETIHDDISH